LTTYKDGITVITPTGDRPTALLRCHYYLERQTIKPNQWLIADDGANKSANKLLTSLPLEILEHKYPNNKALSFTGNLLALISKIEFSKIIIFEDDDWYHPQYIEHTLQRLKDVIICGSSHAIYYNVKFRKYRINQNSNRASFCETAFKADLIPKLKKACYPRGSAFVDARLWKHVRENKLKHLLSNDKRICVGIKGLPGRKGIGIGHRPGGSYRTDPSWNMLKHLIGNEDAQYYMDLND